MEILVLNLIVLSLYAVVGLWQRTLAIWQRIVLAILPSALGIVCLFAIPKQENTFGMWTGAITFILLYQVFSSYPQRVENLALYILIFQAGALFDQPIYLTKGFVLCCIVFAVLTIWAVVQFIRHKIKKRYQPE